MHTRPRFNIPHSSSQTNPENQKLHPHPHPHPHPNHAFLLRACPRDSEASFFDAVSSVLIIRGVWGKWEEGRNPARTIPTSSRPRPRAGGLCGVASTGKERYRSRALGPVRGSKIRGGLGEWEEGGTRARNPNSNPDPQEQGALVWRHRQRGTVRALGPCDRPVRNPAANAAQPTARRPASAAGPLTRVTPTSEPPPATPPTPPPRAPAGCWNRRVSEEGTHEECVLVALQARAQRGRTSTSSLHQHARIGLRAALSGTPPLRAADEPRRRRS